MDQSVEFAKNIYLTLRVDPSQIKKALFMDMPFLRRMSVRLPFKLRESCTPEPVLQKPAKIIYQILHVDSS